jgi:hypothetical protein
MLEVLTLSRSWKKKELSIQSKLERCGSGIFRNVWNQLLKMDKAMLKPKNVTVRLDMKNGFVVCPERINEAADKPVVFSGSFPEAKRLTDIMNKHFEKH